MISTTTEVLHDLFVEAILGITPTVQYQGAEGWEYYGRPRGSSSGTRRFRLGWSAGDYPYNSGIFTPQQVEVNAVLFVRTDYVGDSEKLQHAVIEDGFQLLETLAALKSPSNGLMQVIKVNSVLQEGEEGQDVIVVDHQFVVRYLRERN